jgi:hypothetical protein
MNKRTLLNLEHKKQQQTLLQGMPLSALFAAIVE